MAFFFYVFRSFSFVFCGRKKQIIVQTFFKFLFLVSPRFFIKINIMYVVQFLNRQPSFFVVNTITVFEASIIRHNTRCVTHCCALAVSAVALLFNGTNFVCTD